MTAQCAYASTAAAPLDWYTELNARSEEFRVASTALKADLGVPDAVLLMHRDWYGQSIAGFKDAPKIEGVHFRQLRNGAWWPKLVSKQAKQVASQLRALEFRIPDLPGMPAYVMYGGRRYTSGVFGFEGTIWVSWGCSHEIVEDYGPGGVDLSAWTQRKLSEYHAAREAAGVRD